MTDQATENPSKARTEMLRIRVSKAGVEAIDSLREGWSRSEYVRRALSEAIKANKRGPKQVDL